MKHLITERHEVLVSCDASPSGRHRLTVLRGGAGAAFEIVYVGAECGREGDAAARLGAKTCATEAQLIRNFVRGDATGSRFDLPSGIQDIVRGSELCGDGKRRERLADPVDARVPIVRLLEARVNKLASDAGIVEHLTVTIDSAGTRHITNGNVGGYQSYKNVAHRHPGGVWHLDSDIGHAAKYLGTTSDRCMVCQEHAETVWKDVNQHARGDAHIKNVRRRLAAALDSLPTGGPRG